MTFEIVTRFSSHTFHARFPKRKEKLVCGNPRCLSGLKASSTPGHEFAAKALAKKLIAHIADGGEIDCKMTFRNAAIDSLVPISQPENDTYSYTEPVTWLLTLTEGGAR